jgi:hypothetical protein
MSSIKFYTWNENNLSNTVVIVRAVQLYFFKNYYYFKLFLFIFWIILRFDIKNNFCQAMVSLFHSASGFFSLCASSVSPLFSVFFFFCLCFRLPLSRSLSLSLSCLPLAQEEEDGDKGTTCCWLNGSSLLCVFSFTSLCYACLPKPWFCFSSPQFCSVVLWLL